jgi:hypothetical protein
MGDLDPEREGEVSRGYSSFFLRERRRTESLTKEQQLDKM